jgi:FdhD protein
VTFRALDRPLPLFDRCVSLLHAFPGGRIAQLYREFLAMDALHRETGGTHSAALATTDGVLFSTCDVGRHNAVQKLAGWALLNRRALDDVCILTTGRISSEIVEYAARMGSPVVVSRAAPTLLAVRKALDEGITLLGFVRGRRMNAYSHPERLQ